MENFVHLGTETENAFRHDYMEQKGHPNRAALVADPAHRRRVFQRVISGNNRLQNLYQTELGINLDTIPEFATVVEFFVHRHLYAHNSGLVDDDYLDDVQTLTGADVRVDPVFASLNYPQEDVYWFRPLGRFDHFKRGIEAVIRALP